MQETKNIVLMKFSNKQYSKNQYLTSYFKKTIKKKQFSSLAISISDPTTHTYVQKKKKERKK